jgi:hypothetical protein
VSSAKRPNSARPNQRAPTMNRSPVPGLVSYSVDPRSASHSPYEVLNLVTAGARRNARDVRVHFLPSSCTFMKTRSTDGPRRAEAPRPGRARRFVPKGKLSVALVDHIECRRQPGRPHGSPGARKGFRFSPCDHRERSAGLAGNCVLLTPVWRCACGSWGSRGSPSCSAGFPSGPHDRAIRGASG